MRWLEWRGKWRKNCKYHNTPPQGWVKIVHHFSTYPQQQPSNYPDESLTLVDYKAYGASRYTTSKATSLAHLQATPDAVA